MFKGLFAVSALMLLLIPTVSAADESQNIDWAKIERQLYIDLKEQGREEAQIEEAIGHALLMSDNQWERATVHLKRAVELDPRRFVAWHDLALINIGTDEGDKYFQKSAEANPKFPPNYYWIAYSAVRHRNDQRAISYFEQYLKVAKGDDQEAGRIEVATAVLEELRSGKPGPKIAKIRPPGD